jgi:hypothetical protein
MVVRDRDSETERQDLRQNRHQLADGDVRDRLEQRQVISGLVAGNWATARSGTGASLEFHAKRVPLSPTHLHQVLPFEIQGRSMGPHSHLVLDHFFANAEMKFRRKIGARAQHQFCPRARDVLYQAGDAKFAPAKSDPSCSKKWKARFLPAFLHQHSTEPSTANRQSVIRETRSTTYMNSTPMRCADCQTTLQ